MIKNLIVQAILCERVVNVIVAVGIPVVGELLRAKKQDVLIPRLVVFYNRKRSEGLTQTDGVGKNTTVISFKLIDNSERSILLEIVKHIPNLTAFEARCFVRQSILGYILEELVEDVIKRNEIDELGRVLVIYCRNAFYDLIGYIVELLFIIP